MNRNNILSSLQPGVITVEVAIPGAPRFYTYKALEAWGLEPGDEVVVPARGMFVVGTVAEVNQHFKADLNVPFQYKWIVQKVDFTKYNNLTEADSDFVCVMEEARAKAERDAMLEVVLKDVADADRARMMEMVNAHVPSPVPAIAPAAVEANTKTSFREPGDEE